MCARLALPCNSMWRRPHQPQIALCAGKEEMIDSIHLRKLRSVKLRHGFAKYRDRHRRARPIICVPFWAVTSSLCVSISLFLSLPPFFLYRHRLRPVHKRADQVEDAHFDCPKYHPKWPRLFYTYFLGFSFVYY